MKSSLLKAPIRLIVADLDGTVLTSGKQITDSTRDAIVACREKGVRVIFASARPPRSVQPFYEKCGLDTPQINYNGSLIVDPVKKITMLHRPLDAELTQDIIHQARDRFRQCLISLEVLDRWYTDRVSNAYQTETSRSFRPNKVAPLDDFLDQPITKMMLLGPVAMIDDLERRLNKQFADQVHLVRQELQILQIMSRKASKVQALIKLADHLNVRQAEVLAIGDAQNDVGIIQWSGLGVAMGNACSRALREADYITASNDDDGVARAFKKFILG